MSAKYADLGSLEEDKRIEIIGATAALGKTVAFIVENDAKADRYIKKLATRYPSVAVLQRFKGPVKGTVAVKVGAPVKKN